MNTDDIVEVDQQKIDEALGLQVVNLRIDTDLLDDLEKIAALKEITCHALIRQVLKNFTLET